MITATSTTATVIPTHGAADAGSAHRREALISRLRRKVGDKVGLKLPLRSAYGRGYEFSGHVQLSG